jgi:hypothetical protein
MNNGYVWEKGSQEEKYLYAQGIADGVCLQSVAAASKIKVPLRINRSTPQAFS